jgi:HSP20 family molecular chaperone IbpA
MRRFDLSPLYRSVVGMDRLAQLLESAATTEAASGYPPYNIERTDENAYRIEIAVAGFKPEEMDITAEGNKLSIVVKVKNDNPSQSRGLRALPLSPTSSVLTLPPSSKARRLTA